MIAVIFLLIWDHHKLVPIVSRKKDITIESFPEPDKIWVTAGIIYSVLFLILSVFNPLMGETSGVLTLILLGLTVLTFTGSNYISYKSNRKIFHTPL